MKILFIITQSEIGGAQRFLLEFAPYLAKQGHKIAVVAGEGDGELFRQLESKIKNPPFAEGFGETKQGLKIYQLNSLVRALNPIKDLKAIFYILKVIKTELPDTVFLQSTKAGFLGSLAVRIFLILDSSRLWRASPRAGFLIRVVYRIGGWSFNDPRPWWMNKIIFWMEKASAPLKDVIIVNSEFDRQVAIDKKITRANKIIKIYNGIDAEKLDFLTREEARNAILESGASKYDKIAPLPLIRGGVALPFRSLVRRRGGGVMLIGTIANLYATKGIEYLIESASILTKSYKLKAISFVVIGEGKERPKLEGLIKEYNLENNFFLIGRIPNATEYLKAFDIFVLPSIKEGFPWVLLEAMSAEVPIVATKVGAVPEIIEDGKDGLLVPSRDAMNLARKIHNLISVRSIQIAHDRELFVKNSKTKLELFSLQKMLADSMKTLKNNSMLHL